MKNRFSGAHGPNGSHPITLAPHSGEVPRTFLAMAGHEDLTVAITSAPAGVAIADQLDAVRRLGGNTDFRNPIQRPSSAFG